MTSKTTRVITLTQTITARTSRTSSPTTSAWRIVIDVRFYALPFFPHTIVERITIRDERIRIKESNAKEKMITTKEMHAPQTSLSGQVTYKNVNYAKECSSFIKFMRLLQESSQISAISAI